MRTIMTIGLVLALLFALPSVASAQEEEEAPPVRAEARAEVRTEARADAEADADLMTGRFGLGFNFNLGGNAGTMVRYWINEDLVLVGNLGILLTVDPGPVDANAGLFLGFGVVFNFISDPGAFHFGAGASFDIGIRGAGGTTLAEFALSLPLTLEYFIHPQVSFVLQFGVLMRFGDTGVLIVPLPGGTGSDFALLLGNRGDLLGSAGFTVYFD